MDDPAFATDTDLTTQSLLLAAAHHDISALRDLLRHSSANVQDSDTGFTPLHAAIAALDISHDEHEDGGHVNGDTATGEEGEEGAEERRKKQEREDEIAAAVRTVRLLLQHGAIWNELDVNDETPGCVAERLGVREVYDLMVDAGVRAELLLGRLDGYEALADAEDEEEEESGEEEGGKDEHEEEEAQDAIEVQDNSTTDLAGAGSTGEQIESDVSAHNSTYLSHPVTISDSQILDRSANGVMMSWEGPIMERSAKLLLPSVEARVLNVGHGMGMIDKAFQEQSPIAHHIVEAHPDVLAQMRRDGWYERENVVIHEGKWQDVVPKLAQQGLLFNAIYFDTFAEEYKALRDFFTEHVIGLLEEGGRFGFFNGMGADRQICYDVYKNVVEMDLLEAGFDVDWENIDIPDLVASGEWEGVKRPYWKLKTYRLPTCTFMA
ncbi:arginine N-methyltransferase 2 [Pseudovirgaria hyperparasitica]|uniref:Arginine N-methyltransferase 2 n=1 Tax=Pseudovirgaria hyperparasitica TaxID=470096 RepID=A0A6A6WCX9_9PEZI|nr:arginine N-methyltransferase 2 [Pseudovirgaria hyperparasitica]KAF2760039.1 arginine N-methyltransferase 2 [Pseudovirgaria hyperparasitica]